MALPPDLDLTTLIEKLAGGPLDAAEATTMGNLLSTLVSMTLIRQDRERLQKEIDEIKNDSSLSVDERRDRSKRVVTRDYRIDPAHVEVFSLLYCDRVFTGVDTWDESDREKWIELCESVTEIDSSHV